MSYILKKKDGTYFSLESPQAVSKDKNKATVFSTLKEATECLDTHALWFQKLRVLGFAVYERAIK